MNIVNIEQKIVIVEEINNSFSGHLCIINLNYNYGKSNYVA